MGNFVLRRESINIQGFSVALIALIVFGGLQIVFLALDAIYQFPHWVMMTEAIAALIVTMVCVVVVARGGKTY